MAKYFCSIVFACVPFYLRGMMIYSYRRACNLYLDQFHFQAPHLFFQTKALGTKKVNQFMRGIYANDTFMHRETAKPLTESLYFFIRAYCWEANEAFQRGVAQFPLFPKLHAVHEIAHEMQRQCAQCEYVFNPAATSCSTDEDFVGRTAALSRCVSPRLIAVRTLQRYLVHIQILWARY